MEIQSAEIKDLATALAKVQGQIKGAAMDSENPYFKSQYADLTSVWAACRDLLSSNGLSVIQTMGGGSPDSVTVITTLAHSSGQWIRGELTMKPTKADPQGIGSAITYARRYALASIVGVCPEDDDGAAASGNNKPPRESSQNKNSQQDMGTFSDYVVECIKGAKGQHKDGTKWQAYIIRTQDHGEIATYEEKHYTTCCIANGDGVKVKLTTKPGKHSPLIEKAEIEE
jgi:hypothetical protein